MVRYLIITRCGAFYLCSSYKHEKTNIRAHNCHFISKAIWGTKYYKYSTIRNAHASQIIKNVKFTKESTHKEIFKTLKKQGKLKQTLLEKMEDYYENKKNKAKN